MLWQMAELLKGASLQTNVERVSASGAAELLPNRAFGDFAERLFALKAEPIGWELVVRVLPFVHLHSTHSIRAKTKPLPTLSNASGQEIKSIMF